LPKRLGFSSPVEAVVSAKFGATLGLYRGCSL